MKKRFKLKINGNDSISVEVEGSKEIVESFVSNVFTDSFGIFYKMKDEFSKMFLNGIQVKMATVFRRMNGRIVSPKTVIEEAQKAGFTT